jgi:hypothetical protein
MTGLNLPFGDGEDGIVDNCHENGDGFHTTVNFHFHPLTGISMNARLDSQKSKFLIHARVMYHHPKKAGLNGEVLRFGYKRVLTISKKCARIITANAVEPHPRAVIHDFGLAEAYVNTLFVNVSFVSFYEKAL